MRPRPVLASVCVGVVLFSCARPLPERRALVPPAPSEMPPSVLFEGLSISALALDTKERSEAAFGADTKPAGVLPVYLVVANTGARDVVVEEREAAAVTADGTVVASLTAEDVVERARHASRGTTAAGKVAVVTAVTILVLAAVAGGARVDPLLAADPHGRDPMYAENWKPPASPAAVGVPPEASGDAGRAPEHRWVLRGAFGERALVPGDRAEGFVFLPWGAVSALRLTVRDITAGVSRTVDVPLSITRKDP